MIPMGDVAYQIPFDLGHRTAMGRDDFLIAPNNQDAVAWIDLWPDWPAPILILYGAPASGKSHLAAVWKDKADADFYDISSGSLEDALHSDKHVIIDDGDTIIGDIDREKNLFHLYNIFKEQGRNILLTLENPPVRRNFLLPDLASRLRAAPAVSILEPDDHVLSAVLVKLFGDRQLNIGPDVLNYVTIRIERSFEAARNFVEMADHIALSQKRKISVPLAREILTSDE